MIALALYITALFFIGIGSAVASYHILRYRDPDDISAAILVIYYALTGLILIATAFLINWQELFR